MTSERMICIANSLLIHTVPTGSLTESVQNSALLTGPLERDSAAPRQCGPLRRPPRPPVSPVGSA